MNRLKAGDIVSVLAIVAYNYSPNQDNSDGEFGVAVKVIGPRYTSESVRAKAENVRMVTPKLALGEIVSSGRFDWIILAIVGDYLWLQRDDKGLKIHITAAIHEVARKDTAEAQAETPMEEAPPAEWKVAWSQPAPETILRATDDKLAEIFGWSVEELTGAASKNELEQWEIQTIDGIWTRDTGPGPIGLWTYAALVPPVSEVEF